MVKRWQVATKIDYSYTRVDGDFWTLWGAQRFLKVCREAEARQLVMGRHFWPAVIRRTPPPVVSYL